MSMLFLEGLCEDSCTPPLFVHCHRESEVEHFGKFIHSMKEGVAKMRNKFIDHCNQMSGREYMYMYMLHTCTTTLHYVHVHTCTYMYTCFNERCVHVWNLASFFN